MTGSRLVARNAGFATLAAAALCLSGCGGSIWSSGGDSSVSASSTPVASETYPSGPISLTPRQSGDEQAAQNTYAGSLDDAELKKAIERYRITRRRAESPVQVAAADLNGDGRPEALVLFNGADWCSKTGCSFVVFSRESFGYRPVSHSVNVRAPVLMTSGQSAGWRDLIVKTGGSGSPMRVVRLTFAGSGYSANAALQSVVDQQTVANAVQVLGEQAIQSADTDQTPGAIRRP